MRMYVGSILAQLSSSRMRIAYLLWKDAKAACCFSLSCWPWVAWATMPLIIWSIWPITPSISLGASESASSSLMEASVGLVSAAKAAEQARASERRRRFIFWFVLGVFEAWGNGKVVTGAAALRNPEAAEELMRAGGQVRLLA